MKNVKCSMLKYKGDVIMNSPSSVRAINTKWTLDIQIPPSFVSKS